MPHTGLFNHGQEIQTEALPKRLDIAPPRRDPPRAGGPDGGAMAKARTANGEKASAPTRDRQRDALERRRIARRLLRAHRGRKKPPPVTLFRQCARYQPGLSFY